MKKYLRFLSAGVLALSMLVISACGDDSEGGGKSIPPALIKSLSINYDNGDYVEGWEFTYDIQDRLTRVDVNEGGFEYYFTYDYSVANRLTEVEVYEEGVEEYESVFVLDSEGRIIKSLWDPEDDTDNYDGYEYDEDGYLIRRFYKEDGVEVTTETATVVDGNVMTHTNSERTKNFTYLPSATALNVSNLPQANLRNSERRTVSGLYGKGSRKLVNFLELNYVGAPEDYVKNTNTYSFDENNRVLTITRSGVDKDGIDTGLNEVFTYTYYEDVE